MPVEGVNSCTCKCVTPYVGDTCEQQACGDIFITNSTTLQNARNCATMTRLRVAGSGLEAVTSSDLPFLTSVSGEISISDFAGGSPMPVLTSVTFSKLQSVGGRLQIAATKNLTTASFPELTSVGSIDSITGSLVHWNMPKLTTINGDVTIALQANKCTFNAPRVTTLRGNLVLDSMPKVPASSFAAMVRAAGTRAMQNEIGCCFPADNANCSGPSSDYECRCN
jgi:hypothetical protein